MKLFYMPGTCALAPHTTLIWAGADYDLEQVPRDQLQSPEYLKQNPLGKVPALVTQEHGTLVENAAIQLYIAERFPGSGLGPKDDIVERYRFNRWLSHLGANVHGAFAPVFGAARLHSDESQHAELKARGADNVIRMLKPVDDHLAGRELMIGERLTTLDGYLHVFARWTDKVLGRLSELPNVDRHYQRLTEDRGVQQALKEQGLSD